MLRKRMISSLLVMCMIVSLLSNVGITAQATEYQVSERSEKIDTNVKAAAKAGESNDGSTDVEITKQTYEDLGLELNENIGNNVPEPINTNGRNNPTVVNSAREIYAAANGSKGNRYTLRNGFNKMGEDRVWDTTDISDSNGTMYGAYKYWDINNSDDLEGKSGNTHYSQLSENDNKGNYDVNSMYKGENGFYGIYATSTEFNAGEGKDNYIAELRAYSDDTKSTVDGKEIKGKIGVQLYKVQDATGKRTEVGFLDAGAGDNLVVNKKSLYLYFYRRYIQELDAIFEVEAADVDGDGKDELFVYYGRYQDDDTSRYACVDYYKKSGSSYALKERMKIYAGNKDTFGDGWNGFNGQPVVTIAGGDLSGDGKDEICITVSAPTESTTVTDKARATVYTWNNSQLEKIEALKDISLANGTKAMVSANCAFGTYTLPTEGYQGNVLFIAGYQTHENTANDNKKYTNAAYRCVYFSASKNKYIISDYKEIALGARGNLVGSFSTKDGRCRPIHAPIPLACANLEGITAEDQEDEICFGGDVYSFDLENNEFVKQIGSLSVCTNMENHNENVKDKDQMWISDLQVGCIDTDPQANNWRESFIYVTGVHREDKPNGSDDYYWMNIGAFYLKKQRADADNSISHEEGVIMESNRRGDRYGTFISLCLPDIQQDSIRMEYVDKITTFTNPQVYAVLQASPYFDDLNAAYDYIGNGGTAYSTSKGEGSGKGATVGASAGVYTSAEISLGGVGEYETEIGVEYNYSYMKSKDLEYSIEYNNQSGGTDKVVLYSIPLVCYEYLLYQPGNSEPEKVYYTCPLQPATSIVDLEIYDEVARQTAGLEVIGGNLITSTPGKPETYKNSLKGENVYRYNGDYSAANALGSGADISQTISYTETEERNHEVNAYINGKVGAGVGIFGTEMKSGVTASVNGGVSFAKSYSEGISYTGVVDNLPSEADQYGFSWKLMVNQAYLNGKDNPVWIVGYDVINVYQPPTIPQNLAVTGVTDDSVVLEWDASAGATYYELYMVDALGDYNLLTVVPSSALQYEVEELDSNTTYHFTVRAGSNEKGCSDYAPSVNATTLNGGSFEVVENPQDQSTYVGGSAVFTTIGKYTNAAGKANTVSYAWQVSKDNGDTWTTLSAGDYASGINTNSLKLTNVTEDMHGWMYRAKIYHLNRSLFTEGAKLIIDKAKSTSELLTDDIVYDKAIINSTGTIRTSNTETVYNVKSVSIDNPEDDKKYVLYTNDDYTEFYWSDGTQYYPCDTNASIDTDTYTIDGKEQTVIDEATIVEIDDIGTQAYEEMKGDYRARILEVVGEDSIDVDVKDESLTVVDVSENETLTVDTVEYKVLEKWKMDDGLFVYCVEEQDASEDSDKYYYYESKDGEDTVYGSCTISSTSYIKEGVPVNSLQLAYQAVESEVVTYTDNEKAGDTVTLRAKAKSSNGDLHEGIMKFVISGATSQQIVATYDETQQCYTAQWAPQTEGTYYIAAQYAGDNKYYASTSQKIEVHTVMKDNSKISITAPGNMTYGKNTKLSVVQLSGGDENTQENVTSTVDYFVEKLSDVTNKYETATDEEYTIEAGVFTPKTTGRFNITAKKDNVSDSAVIHVDKGLITISADDQTSSVNKERNDLTASIVGYASFDESKINNLTPGTDYEMQSDAISTDAAGDYIVYPVLKNTDKMQDLQNLYSIILEKGLYTLTSSAYEVNVETDTKGTAEIKYETTGRSIKVKTGDLVPENSRVIIEATPKEGYSIAGWQVDGNLVEESGTVVKDSLYTIDSLTSDKNIKVLFEDITSKVSYKVHADEQDKLNGTVRGTYSTVDGYEFSSGSQLAYKQSIVVQAQPNEGYVVDHWTIQSGDEIATVIKAEDGINSYTGSTYTFTKLTKDTQIEVYFAKQTTIPVSLKFVDGEGIAMKDKVSVNINGTDITSDSEGVFHYDGINGDNLCIQVNVPENLLVNSWNVSDGQSTGTLSNDNKTMNIYNLQKETDFVVQTDAFNTYEVSFTTKVDDDSDATKAGMLIATKRSTSEEIVSGTAHIQGSAIELNATPKLGYEIKEWLVNGKVVQGEAKENGVQSYTVSSLSADTTVVVVFRKNVEFIDLKVQSGKNGTVVTKVGVENQLEEIDATNGVEIPAGNIVEIKATPADGYMVKNWTVNDVVQSDKSNVLTLADVKEDTVIKVTYQLIVLYNLPVNGTDYTITDIKRNPDEYGTGTGTNGADQIRDGGNVSFKLTPTKKEGKIVTVKAIKIFGVDCANDKNEYPVKADNGSLITSVMNTDGSYAITVDNVKADMNLDVTLQYQDESSKEQNKDEGNKEQNKDESNKEEVATKCVVNYSALDNGKLVVKTPEGTAIENGASVDVGTTLVCAATPDEYYELDTLNVNNKAVNPSRNGNEYLYTIVTEASVPVVTIEASFVVAKDLGFDDADKFENFKVKAVGKNKAIKVTWAKIPEADGYYVYGTKCKTEFKKIKTITNPSKVSFTQKNLKKGQYYKYKLAAYKTIDGKNYIIANSIDVHAVTKGGKYADPTKIKVNKTKINLRKGKKATIKASYTIQKGKKQALHISKFRYESTDKTIATVNKKGVVKGIKKGTAYIYVYAQNGVYKKVKVTVK
ncbi:MAG: hypothetical protein E7264_02965 [Lachnospiraceae bacterium]|nr:hypothetical protein [Lachnospiraceae bacterium]